jgi:pyruvate dehydrogenase E2 component (dihydrolipoamide acetyltransferase)
MAQEITLTMEGTLLNWLKNVGDPVSSGDIVAEIEADKATVEIEAPGDGVITELRVQPGDALSEGDVIAMLGAADEAPSGGGAAQSEPQAEARSAGPEAEVVEDRAAVGEGERRQPEAPRTNGAGGPATTDDGRTKISPIARRMAEDRGIDISQVQGSGPGGRIVKADIENFKPGAAPAAAPGRPAAAPSAPRGELPPPPARKMPTGEGVEVIDLTTMRRRIAATTVEAKQFTPHFYVTTEMDVTELLALRKQLNDSLPEGARRISVNDMVVKAAALTMRQFPNLNSHYYGEQIVRYESIHVGIAVALPQGGLIYVVSRDADQVALGTLAERHAAMFTRARESKIKPDDINGATFSISNLGPYGVEHFSAIINPPEAMVLAIGTAQKVPVVRDDGTIGVGNRMNVTISIDHRVSDGAEGAEYLQVFKGLIENPLQLLV